MHKREKASGGYRRYGENERSARFAGRRRGCRPEGIAFRGRDDGLPARRPSLKAGRGNDPQDRSVCQKVLLQGVHPCTPTQGTRPLGIPDFVNPIPGRLRKWVLSAVTTRNGGLEARASNGRPNDPQDRFPALQIPLNKRPKQKRLDSLFDLVRPEGFEPRGHAFRV